VSAPRRQINITPDPRTFAFIQAQAEELDLPVTQVAARLLAKGVAEMQRELEGPEVEVTDMGKAVAELDRKLTGLIRAHYNAAVRLLVGLGIPRAQVAAFSARRLRIKDCRVNGEADDV
jgi:hypothetical protein